MSNAAEPELERRRRRPRSASISSPSTSVEPRAGPAAEAIGPEHPVEPLVGRQRTGGPRPGLRRARRGTTGPDLISTTQPTVTSPIVRLAVAAARPRPRRSTTRGPPSPAACRRSGRPRARARARRRARPARGPRSRRRRPGARSARKRSSSSSASASIANVTSPPAPAPRRARAGVRAEQRAARARAARAPARGRARRIGPLRSGVRRPLAELDLDRAPLAVAHDLERDRRRPGSWPAISVGQVVRLRERRAVDRDDHVAAGRRCRAGPGTRSCRRPPSGRPCRPGCPSRPRRPARRVDVQAEPARRAAGRAAGASTPRKP